MSNPSNEDKGSGAIYWAKPGSALSATHVPPGVINQNVDGRAVVGPLQGFGSLWQKTYRLGLDGAVASPEEVIETWKYHLPEFQPKQNRFFPAIGGMVPGETMLINAALSGIPLNTGMLVLYADEVSFTLMTPEGHPESGWVTFSASSEGDNTVCQVQSLARATDPMYEMGFRFMGGAKAQEAIWHHVLKSLAAYYQVDVSIAFEKTCVDRQLQWSQFGNLWRNAMIRSTFYRLAVPTRWFRRGAVVPRTFPAKRDAE